MQCSFDALVRYLDKELDVDRELEVLDHIDECDTCRDAVFHISFDRDADLVGTT
jgi:anti-sigma factor RsiW